MGKILLASIVLLCTLYASELDTKNSVLDKTIKDKVMILENEGEHETAREIISLYMDENNAKNSMQFWLKVDRKLFSGLNQNIKNHLTHLPVIQVSNKNKIDSVDLANETIKQSIPIYGLLKDAYDTVNDNHTIQKAINGRKELSSFLKNYSITCIAPKLVKEKLVEYDVLKESQENLKKQLSIYLKHASKKEFNNFIQILKQQNKLKKQIKNSRTNYVSYNVISPYLADVQRYIVLSNTTELIGHDEDYLRNAARLMAKGAYKDILLQANEDTREEFYKVYSMLKETAGDKEWEDLKVLQTLMDSASKAKKTGANLWWE